MTLKLSRNQVRKMFKEDPIWNALYFLLLNVVIIIGYFL